MRWTRTNDNAGLVCRRDVDNGVVIYPYRAVNNVSDQAVESYAVLRTYIHRSITGGKQYRRTRMMKIQAGHHTIICRSVSKEYKPFVRAMQTQARGESRVESLMNRTNM